MEHHTAWSSPVFGEERLRSKRERGARAQSWPDIIRIFCRIVWLANKSELLQKKGSVDGVTAAHEKSRLVIIYFADLCPCETNLFVLSLLSVSY